MANELNALEARCDSLGERILLKKLYHFFKAVNPISLE